MSGIGLLNEKPLHASLKEWYAQPEDQFEVVVDGFVIDIVRGDLLLEIQTGNLASIKSKLNSLVRSHQIRLIYPIAQEKRIVKLAKDGNSGVTCRKSPKRGRVEDLFWEMVSFPQLLANPNFSLEVLMIWEEQVRRYEGKRKRRRGGWVIEERRLLGVVEQRLYEEPADWHALLPDGLGTFTARDLADATGLRRALAQKMLYCLRKVTVVKLIGKQGRANLYAEAGA
ncbi:MAG: hypothetical protein AMS18_17770 [Gemmatimonas sp. SG8_17]|nr:MAG: hypothetical protein AMS18_17770 [Gemmatimonas sp. SG8_17]